MKCIALRSVRPTVQGSNPTSMAPRCVPPRAPVASVQHPTSAFAMPTIDVSLVLFSLFLSLLLSLVPLPSFGQEIRYDLGLRLRRMERALEGNATDAARRASLPHLKSAVTSFFSLRLDSAGRALDEAWLTLPVQRADFDLRWAAALRLSPATRLADIDAGPTTVKLISLDKAVPPIPDDASVEILLRSAGGPPPVVLGKQIRAWPWEGQIVWAGRPEGDGEIVLVARRGEQSFELCAQTVSSARNIAARLDQLDQSITDLPKTTPPTWRATAEMHAKIVRRLWEKETLETDYPAARLLQELEAALDSIRNGRRPWGLGSPGDFWLTLASDRGSATVRLMAPDAKKDATSLPLVIAMHGAGGSENMFYDAYGAGKIVRLCRDRGWLLVCPRSGFFGQPMSVADLVEHLSEWYPIDRERVFLVGHSMGAAQAISAAQSSKLRPAAVAALGGGGSLSKLDIARQIRFFVGVGREDFALGGARRLADSLKKANCSVDFREYADVEHLAIVQLALDDVFAYFEQLPAAERR